MMKRLLLPIGLLLSLLTPVLHTSAFAQPTKSSAVCSASFYQGGTPPATVHKAAPQGRIICASFFAVNYSTTLRDPVWTSYQQTKAMSDGGDSIGRYTGNFRLQPGLTASEQGHHNDYNNQGFARGHLTPANDAIDMPRQRDTFVVTNIVPQNSPFNSGLWRYLEASVHRLAQVEGSVFIVTGALFPANPTRIPRGAAGRIAVPDAMYKAIFVPSRNIAIAYIATNMHPSDCIVVSIAELTQRTGVDPFPALPAAAKVTRPNFTLPRGLNPNGSQLPLPDCRAT